MCDAGAAPDLHEILVEVRDMTGATSAIGAGNSGWWQWRKSPCFAQRTGQFMRGECETCSTERLQHSLHRSQQRKHSPPAPRSGQGGSSASLRSCIPAAPNVGAQDTELLRAATLGTQRVCAARRPASRLRHASLCKAGEGPCASAAKRVLHRNTRLRRRRAVYHHADPSGGDLQRGRRVLLGSSVTRRSRSRSSLMPESVPFKAQAVEQSDATANCTVH